MYENIIPYDHKIGENIYVGLIHPGVLPPIAGYDMWKLTGCESWLSDGRSLSTIHNAKSYKSKSEAMRAIRCGWIEEAYGGAQLIFKIINITKQNEGGDSL